MKQDTVLLLFGGESSEHDVSIASARNVFDAIDHTKFNVVLGFIDTTGKWWHVESIDETPTRTLIPQLGAGAFLAEGTTIVPDVILPILHGKNGEDGAVAALGQLLHVPVVGCDMTAGAICMDKRLTKEILAANDIAVVPYVAHRTGEPLLHFSDIEQQLGMPVFVKPARAGSSVGVSKVQTAEELTVALAEAHKHDEVVLVEKGVNARELEVAALGNPPHYKVSGVGEIVLSDTFYSYDEKYSDASGASVVVPAAIDAAVSEQIRQQALKAYELLGCRGLARIDFFLSTTGELYINEINTLPGFTNISMYPKLWQTEGVSYSALIEALIFTAKPPKVTTE